MKKLSSKFSKDLSIIASEYEAILKYIYFVGNYVYVSNGHIFVKHHLKHHNFNESEIKLLDGKCLLATDFSKVYKSNIVELVSNNDKTYFRCFTKGVATIVQLETPHKLFDIVEWERYIPKKLLVESKIGMSINFSLLMLIHKIMLSPTTNVTMYFDGMGNIVTKSIIMCSNEFNLNDEVIMCMPFAYPKDFGLEFDITK